MSSVGPWRQPEPELLIEFEPLRLRKTFEAHRHFLERQSLARLRGGQQYLFDRVFHARGEELSLFLQRGISKATWLCPTRFWDARPDLAKALSRVAIALLAARILEDKDFFGVRSEQSTDARRLLRDAEQAANGFFGHIVSNELKMLETSVARATVDEMLERILAHLTGPACFSLVTPEMLGHFYETALIAKRRQGNADLPLRGIHYTPQSLTKHIIDRLPVEELSPDHRYVLDFACGSGAFLLSATSRLREIFDPREPVAETAVAEHLRRHVLGNDKDDVAVLITRLAYLLSHWVETRTADQVPEPEWLATQDALDLTIKDFGGIQPSVIVGNPPFASHDDSSQLANHFLRKALELLAPGGFLGMIMPGGFLKMRRQKCPETRRELLEICELLEVWEMPKLASRRGKKPAPS